MANKEIRVAILRKTNNLENDDRIRKEVGSLTKLFPNIKFKCFVMYPENRGYEGQTSYGLSFKSVCVESRDKYASGKHLIAKSWNYYRTIKKDIKDFDVVWCSGDAPTPTLLFVYGKKTVWDLRELPLFLMGSKVKQIILKYIFRKCDICLHANQFRIDYLTSMGLIKNKSKHIPLRNFPEFSIVDTKYDERYNEVKEWIAGRKCIYLQGIDSPTRASNEVLTAVIETSDVCAIILGRIDNNAIDGLKKKYGEEEVSKRICIAGNFPVLKIPQYMELCCASMVFYKNTSPNNWYCEANRLYQAIDMGLPVLVGANPPMKAVVEEFGVGLSVDTDGNDTWKIVHGLNALLSNCEEYRKHIEKLKDEIKWDSQISLLQNTFESLFI